MPRSASSVPQSITVQQLLCCADDSYDRGSCRIRLSSSAWASAGIPYHRPVIVTIAEEGSTQPWRVLCIAALSPEDHDLETTVGRSQHLQQGLKAQPERRASSATAGAPVAAPVAVLDPTVVVVPPGAELAQLPRLLRNAAPYGNRALSVDVAAASPGGVNAAAGRGPGEAPARAGASLPRLQVEVTACPGPGVTVATEVQLRVPPGLEHLVSPPTLSFKLHQALVLPGCCLRLSESCAVFVEAVHPTPASPDQPIRIVPSTRLVLAGQQRHQSDLIALPLQQPVGQPHQGEQSENPMEGEEDKSSATPGDRVATERRSGSKAPIQGSPRPAGRTPEGSEPGSAGPASAGSRKVSGRAGIKSKGQLASGMQAQGDSAAVSGAATGAPAGLEMPPEAATTDNTSSKAASTVAESGTTKASRPAAGSKAKKAHTPALSGNVIGEDTGTEEGGSPSSEVDDRAPRVKSKSKADKPKAGKSKAGKGSGAKGGGIAASASAFDALRGLMGDDD